MIVLNSLGNNHFRLEQEDGKPWECCIPVRHETNRIPDMVKHIETRFQFSVGEFRVS